MFISRHVFGVDALFSQVQGIALKPKDRRVKSVRTYLLRRRWLQCPYLVCEELSQFLVKSQTGVGDAAATISVFVIFSMTAGRFRPVAMNEGVCVHEVGCRLWTGDFDDQSNRMCRTRCRAGGESYLVIAGVRTRTWSNMYING